LSILLPEPPPKKDIWKYSCSQNIIYLAVALYVNYL
jgi:hypothetical protein